MNVSHFVTEPTKEALDFQSMFKVAGMFEVVE
jgi:hypothetical protein